MTHYGDFIAGRAFDGEFNTNDALGAPATLAGTPTIAVYKNNATAESTAGATLVVDFDGRTGLNSFHIDTSADAVFYAAGNDFRIVITAGTVGGQSVAGRVIGHFSIQNRTGNVSVVQQ
jgi:hypothetical protein